MNWTIDPRNPMPIYAQLAEAVRRAVATGHLSPGEQLPTVRQLAVELKINPNTVARAYTELERDGIIATRQGQGTFVLGGSAPGASPRDMNRLREIVESALLEAHRLGFTPSEFLELLQSEVCLPEGDAPGEEGKRFIREKSESTPSISS